MIYHVMEVIDELTLDAIYLSFDHQYKIPQAISFMIDMILSRLGVDH